jgi:hypothetical protein
MHAAFSMILTQNHCRANVVYTLAFQLQLKCLYSTAIMFAGLNANQTNVTAPAPGSTTMQFNGEL